MRAYDLRIAPMIDRPSRGLGSDCHDRRITIGIQLGWIINLISILITNPIELIERVAKVYREPFGDGYASRRILNDASMLTPHSASMASITVRDLLS